MCRAVDALLHLRATIGGLSTHDCAVDASPHLRATMGGRHLYWSNVSTECIGKNTVASRRMMAKIRHSPSDHVAHQCKTGANLPLAQSGSNPYQVLTALPRSGRSSKQCACFRQQGTRSMLPGASQGGWRRLEFWRVLQQWRDGPQQGGLREPTCRARVHGRVP